MKEELMICGDLQVYIIRKNIKNLYLRVREPDGRIEISAPVRMTRQQIMEFVAMRREWILQARETVIQRALVKEDKPVEPPFIEREKRQKLKKQLQELLDKWEPRMGVRSCGFTIKKMKTRWGSCNVKTGHLNFNYALADRRPEEVEYVVVHELTHLLEPSHNERFWALMEHYLPGAKRLRKQLNDRI